MAALPSITPEATPNECTLVSVCALNREKPILSTRRLLICMGNEPRCLGAFPNHASHMLITLMTLTYIAVFYVLPMESAFL